MKARKRGTTKKTSARSTIRENEEASALASYRQHLVLASQKAQADYDRNVMALSGGAIGVSLIFLRDIIKQSAGQARLLVVGAWITWGASILVVLVTFLLSKSALDTAINQVDAGVIYEQKPGKGFSTVLPILNIAGGLLFLVGIVLLAVFVYAHF